MRGKGKVRGRTVLVARLLGTSPKPVRKWWKKKKNFGGFSKNGNHESAQQYGDKNRRGEIKNSGTQAQDQRSFGW